MKRPPAKIYGYYRLVTLKKTEKKTNAKKKLKKRGNQAIHYCCGQLKNGHISSFHTFYKKKKYFL